MRDSPHPHEVRLGMRANLAQFSLLVLVNVCVGGLVGAQRSVMPLVAEQDFGMASAAAATAFIISFGATKAISNLISGVLADRIGRRRTLILGWLIGLPVPVVILLAPSWNWIVGANVLLGINQGLAWSMTVVMKIDLVGPSRRGLAMGLNECAGYGAVGLAAWITGWLGASHDLRGATAAVGTVCVVAGFLLSLTMVRDTRAHAAAESALHPRTETDSVMPMARVFGLTSWRNRNLSVASQAGLVNNLNDAVAWGILPLLLVSRHVDLTRISLIAAAYPVTWAVAQLFFGAASDRWGRKGLIVAGMWLQAAAHAVIGFGGLYPFASGLTGSITLGLGTAMVYPTLLAAVGDAAPPAWRAKALAVYRFWRDSGYALGALAAGLIADRFGLPAAIHGAGVLTFLSGCAVAVRMTRGARQGLNRPRRL